MPYYRYECDRCGRINEKWSTLKEGAPADHSCHTLLTYLEDQPKVATPDGHELSELVETHTEPCKGTMRRIYDNFQFHISGR